MPGCLLSRYSPVPAVSVPFCCVTRYCSGESLEMASGSLLNFLISFSSCRTCMEGTPRVRAALTVEAAATLCRGQRLKESLEFPHTGGLPKIPASLVLSVKLVKDLPGPVHAIKELQEAPHTPFKSVYVRSEERRVGN